MRLLPQDLGTKWHIMTVRNRALGVASVWKKPTEPRLGELGKRWIKDLPVSEEVAATTLPLTKDKTSGWVGVGLGMGWIFPVVALLGIFDPNMSVVDKGILEAIVTGTGALFGYGTLIGLPRNHLKKLHGTALSEEELTPFLTGNVPGLPPVLGEMASKLLRFMGRQIFATEATTEDELERVFLLLVRDVIRLQTIPKESEEDLRGAIRAIGEALCRLPDPETTYSGSSIDAADQLAEAQMLHARADRERDPVVAASLRRQAEALEHAAHAADNAVTVSRRVRALRQELRAQIDVLRLTLPTWGRPGHSHTASSEQSLSQIAESVHSVAREAAAVSEAQDELDDYLTGRNSRRNHSYTTQAEPDVQTLRAR